MLKLLNYTAVLAVWIVSTVEADCNTKHQESPAFGTNCAYRCHCLNNVQCDNVTGECPDGCEIGWMGPACQYRNLVPGHLGKACYGNTMNRSDFAKYAVDRNRSTCCKTDPASGAGQQFCRIEMKRAYIISGLKIVIKQEDVENFRGFRIECGFSETNFSHICYEHPNIPGSVDMEVSCNKPVYANHLQIILRLENVPLSLCEVEIYGGREIAFNRPTNGTPQYMKWSPNQAVDGKFLTHREFNDEYARRSTCYAGVYSKPLPENPWWTVDLGTVFEIEDVYYYGREEDYRTRHMEGFFVLLSNGSDGPYTRLYNDTVSDTFYLPKEAKLRSVASGRIVRVERAIPQDTLIICELMVFGECPANACGLNCATHCHCASEYITGPDKIYGTCPRGCAGRWTGVGKRCDTECTEDKWGTACQNECGHCSTSPCDVRNGSCPTGCLGDLWQPPYCTVATLDLLHRNGAVQSVTMSSSSPNMTPEKAYDGNPSRDPESCQCCSQTLNSESSWWMVTFQHKYPIGKMFIHGRTNENTHHQIAGFSVELGNTTAPEIMWKIIYTGNTSDVHSDFEIDVFNELASSVRIRRAGVLTICDIKIMEGDCQTGWFGEFCSLRCHCVDQHPCDRLSGTCQTPVCDVGWLGPACNRSCPEGKYGQRCEQTCKCLQCTADYGICEETADPPSSTALLVVVGILATVVVLVIIISAIVAIRRKRMLCFREDVYARPKRATDTEADTYDTLQSISGTSDAPIRMEERHTYTDEVPG